MYRILFNCVFCLAFINFLHDWLKLFWKEEGNFLTMPNHANDNSTQPMSNQEFPKTGWKRFLNQLSKAGLQNSSTSTRKHLNSSLIIGCLLWFVLTLLIFFRITQSNHFPLANFYEALIFLTWCLVTLNIIILLEANGQAKPVNDRVSKNPLVTWLSWSTALTEAASVQKEVATAILAPIILFILTFAEFHLSSDITPLVPALKSNWLLMHVRIMLCSYTLFIMAGLLSLVLLMQSLFSSTRVSKLRLLFYSMRSDGVKPKKFENTATSLVNMNIDQRCFLNKDPVVSMDSNGYKNPQALPANVPYGLDWSEYRHTLVSKDRYDNHSFRSSASTASKAVFQAPSIAILPVSFVSKETRSTKPCDDDQALNALNQKAVDASENQLMDFTKPLSNLNSNQATRQLSLDPFLGGGLNLRMPKKNFSLRLDNQSYRMMGVGFPLFTLGILSGAVWANEAWGSYWSWDIKEVGSFINWLLVALYFHCRYKNYISLSHSVAFLSLVVLFFNFFGISLGIFGSSLHAYGAAS